MDAIAVGMISTALYPILFSIAGFLWTMAILRWIKRREPELERARLNEVADRLHQNFVFVETSTLRVIIKTVLLGSILVSLYQRALYVFLGSLAFTVAAPLWISRRIAARRKRRVVSQFQNWLPMVAGLLKTGQSLEQCIVSTSTRCQAPLSQELELILKEVEMAVPLEEALHRFSRRYGHMDLRMFSRISSISIRTGAPILELIESQISAIKRRRDFQNRLASLTAQPKIQSKIGILIPGLLFFGLTALDPSYLDPLKQSDVGRVILRMCVLVLILGAYWMHRIADIDSPC